MKRLQKIGLALSSIIITLIFCEFIIRAYFDSAQSVKVGFKGDLVKGASSQFKLSNDPILLYEWRHLPQKVSQNKSKNTFRIIVLGDSITYRSDGTGIDNFYPRLLENMLNKYYNSKRYKVLNSGVPGYNTIQEVRYLEKRLLKYSPDLVIVGYCAQNDRVVGRKIIKYKDGLYCSDVRESYPYFLNLPFDWNNFLIRKSALYRFVNLVLINMAGKFHLDYIIHNIKHFDLSGETEKAVKRIKYLSVKKHFGLLFVVFPTLDNSPHYEAEWIINKCRKYNIKYIDLRNIFQTVGYKKLKILPQDHCHPNKWGQKLAAEAIFEYFKGSINKDAK